MATPIVRFHCPFVGINGCQDRGGLGLTRGSLVTHLRDRHFGRDALDDTKLALSTSSVVYDEAESTFRRMGRWLCGVCYRTHTVRAKCRHEDGSVVAPPDAGDGVVHFVLYDLARPAVPVSSPNGLGAADVVPDPPVRFGVALFDSLLSKRLCTVKSIPPKCRLSFARVLKGALDRVIGQPDDISCWVQLLVLPLCVLRTFSPRSCRERRSSVRRHLQEEGILSALRLWGEPGGTWALVQDALAASPPRSVEVDEDMEERSILQCKRKVSDGHFTAAVRVLSSSGIAPYSDATLEDLTAKHPFVPGPSLSSLPADQPFLVAPVAIVRERIRSFPRGTSCGRDGLRAQHLLDCLSGAAVAVSDELLASITQVVNLFLAGRCPAVLGPYIASAPLTPLVKPGGGIRPIAVGTVWRRLVSKVGASLVGPTLSAYFADLQFGVGVSAGGRRFCMRLIVWSRLGGMRLVFLCCW